MSEEIKQAAIVNCVFEFGVGVEELPNGQARIFVVRDLITPQYDGAAIREFMEDLAVAWLHQVAPHRLAQDEALK